MIRCPWVGYYKNRFPEQTAMMKRRARQAAQPAEPGLPRSTDLRNPGWRAELAGHQQLRILTGLQGGQQKFGGADERVSVDRAEAGKLSLTKTGQPPKYSFLFAMGKFGLKADHIIDRSLPILFTKLYHCMGQLPGTRVLQADRLHGTVAQGFDPSSADHFDGQTALEIFNFLEIVQRGILRRVEVINELQVLVLVQRAIEVISGTVVIA